jgi:glycerophosphoryl diester phosphodiesterase
MTKIKHDYLMTLVRELEKEGNKIKLDTFIIAVEDLLQIKYRLRNYFDYPISEPQYDELIEKAENLLGVEHKETEINNFATDNLTISTMDPKLRSQIYVGDNPLSGRTNGATSADGASNIVTDALVDYSLINMDFVNHILKSYTPDQLTIDIIKQAAEQGTTIDGSIVNKQTADYIETRIKQIQKSMDAGKSDNGLYSDQWIAFTAKQDIKKGDFVLIDEHDNQSVTPAKDMEISPTTLEDLFKEFENKQDIKVETVTPGYEKRLNDFFELSDEVMEEYKEAYAALGSRDSGYNSGAVYSMEDVKMLLEQAPEGYKTIWYYSPFEQFFVGDISGTPNFPFIYKDSDPSHNDYVKNTAVVGPFHSVEELEKYFDLLVHENAGVDDGFIKDLTELVAAIKFYESRNDAAKYDTIIDSLWSALRTFLLGNI